MLTIASAEPRNNPASNDVPVLSIREQSNCGNCSGFCYCCYLAGYQNQHQDQYQIQHQPQSQNQQQLLQMQLQPEAQQPSPPYVYSMSSMLTAGDYEYNLTLSGESCRATVTLHHQPNLQQKSNSNSQMQWRQMPNQPVNPSHETRNCEAQYQSERQLVPGPTAPHCASFHTRRRALNNQSARKSRAKRREEERQLMQQFADASCQLYAELLAYSALLAAKQSFDPCSSTDSEAAGIQRAFYYEGLCFGLREAHARRGLPMRVPVPWQSRSCEDLRGWSGRRFVDYVAAESLQAWSVGASLPTIYPIIEPKLEVIDG